MKRRISLLLAVVMILGSFSFAFAANDEVKPAEFLEKQGVLKGNAKGDLMLDEALLRRDAVVLLSRLMNAEEEAKGFKKEGFPTFKDITDNHYVGYLAWAQSNEYIKGHDDKGERFGFNDNLTTREYSTVLLRALGYVEEAKDWDKVFETAKKLGLLEKVEKEADAEITRADMAQMTFNALGVKMKDSDKTLAEFLGIEMPAPEVLEYKVKADNLKEIKIELNNAKLVDVDQVEDARNYRTDAGNVIDAKLVENTIILTLKDAMTQNRKYTLTTRYIKGLELDKEAFVAFDNEAPAVEKVTVLGTKGIRVRMTEPVTGANEKDFKLDGKNFVMRVKHYGRDILLIPYRENGTFEEGKHELTIGQLEDYAGFKSKVEVHDIEIVKDETKPEVAKVIARNNSVIVEFVNEVFPDSVAKSNVSWEEVRGRTRKEADGFEILAGNKVEYKFDKNQLPKPSVRINIKGLENYSGVAMDAYSEIHDIEVDFSRPEIVNFKFIETDADKRAKMEIEFNKNLEEKSAEDVDNFELYEYKVSDSAYKVSKYAIDKAELDGRFVTVTFREGTLKAGNKYKLNVEGIRDNSVLRNTMMSDELEFTYGIGEKLSVVAVRERGKERIVLEFNKDLRRADVESLRNYEFELKNENGRFRPEDLSNNPSVYLLGDGRIVEINLPNNGKEIVAVHLGSGLTALDGNRVDVANRRVVLKDSYLAITSAELDRKGEKLTVGFNQEITTKPENDKVTLGKATKNANFKVELVKGKLEITGFDGVPTEVKIAKGSSIATKYEENDIAKTKDLVFDDIDDKRDLAIDVFTAKLDGNKLTITVKLNQAIDGKQEENIDILVDGAKKATLGRATRSAGVYTYVYEKKADETVKKVRLVGEDLDKTVDVEPATPVAPIELKLTAVAQDTAPVQYDPGVPATQGKVTVAKTNIKADQGTGSDEVDTNTKVSIASLGLNGSTSSKTITLTDEMLTADKKDVVWAKLAAAINELDLDVKAKNVTATGFDLVGLEDGSNNVSFTHGTVTAATSNNAKELEPEQEMVLQVLEFTATANSDMLKAGNVVKVNTLTGKIISVDKTAKTFKVQLDESATTGTPQSLAANTLVTSFKVTADGVINTISVDSGVQFN